MKKETAIGILTVVILFAAANILLNRAYFNRNAGKDGGREKNIPVETIDDAKMAKNRYDFAYSTPQKKAIAGYAYASLDNYFKKGEMNFPKELESADFEYDRVFVTLINDGKLRCCQSGRARSDSPQRLKEDLEMAVERCINDERFGGKIKEEEIGKLEMVVDFLHGEKPVAGHSASEIGKSVDMGLNAIKIEQGGKSAYFKASVPIEKNYDLETTLERLCVKAKLDEDCYEDPDTKIYKYGSVNFTADRSGKVADLYRCNVLLDAESIDRDRLFKSISLGYNWLKNDVNAETKMVEYMYLPSSDSYDKSTNHVRILAASWAATEMMDFLDTDSMKETVRATLDDYLGKYKREGGNGVYLEINGDAKIAYNAFPLMALINARDYPNRDGLMRDLAAALLGRQQSDGRLLTDFVSGGEDGIDFYAGESLLALVKLYYETGEQKYFDAVKLAFPYYRDYWRENKNTAFIPWQTQAYFLMYKKEPNREWADFIFEINDWLIDEYQQQTSKYPDYVGGFKQVPGYSTSSYAESVCDAYAFAKLAGDKVHEKKFLDSCRLAIRFVLQTQYTQENVFYLENRQKALGGFRESLLNNRQRCDFAQHAVLSSIKAYNHGVFD